MIFVANFVLSLAVKECKNRLILREYVLFIDSHCRLLLQWVLE